MYRGHPHTYPDFEQERRVWGHPCGKPFPSMGVFAIHVRAVIEEYLRRCRCWLCDAPDTESDPSYVKGPFDLAKMRREGISLEEVRRKDKRLRRVGSTEIIPKRAGRAWSINRTLSVAADRPIHFLLTSEQRTWKQKADLTVLITPTKVKASQQSGADVIGLMRVNEALQQMYLPSLMRKGSTVLSLESLDIHVEFKIILPFDRKSVRA
ncbi:hypothetical protein M438DRAFT_35436 [Aureobasidium pullulans EXF-150]|uniref:Cryptic loci regulator 2 N-terminal domain-containing protein n=1 Tax=Aureobasidium pullulans EXF-150 TaxID=1043002 RepID=A0A074XIM6_AURPU|nr:uncharacterized protein M438DRAFT_35436 [Aureobasidium pullulans EXF-150]KEQ83529.1 hypothetical protein M438DRAFT_35436 [Aureobasidium pullulans EXF-150]